MKAQLQALQQQAAALAQQIQLLQQKVDQKSDSPAQPIVQSSTPTALKSAPLKAAASLSAVSPSAGPAKHGFFERKPGDKVTFYLRTRSIWSHSETLALT